MNTGISLENIDSSIRYSAAGGYCYVHNAKAACSTIKYALWKKEFSEGRIGFLPTATQLHGEGFWSTRYSPDLAAGPAFTFSIVRNPFARVLSCYLDKICMKGAIRSRFCAMYQIAESETISFERFLSAIVTSSPVRDDQHWRPQVQNLLIGAMPLDFVGFLEHFHEDFGVIAGRIGLSPEPETKNPHATNASDALSGFLTPLAIDLIREKYAEDFKSFGYDLNPSEPMPRKRNLRFEVENEAGASFMRAAALEKTDPSAAVSELTKALSLTGMSSVYPLLTKCLVAAGNPAAAWQAASEGIARFPENHDTLSALALLHMQRDEVEKAADIYGRLTEIVPETTKYWIVLQKLLTRLGRFDEAISVASRATGMKKAMAKVQAKAGAVCLHLTRLDEALRHFDAALKLDSANKAANVGRMKTLFRLSRHAEKSGDSALATELIKRALAADPEDEALQQRLRQLSARAARRSMHAGRE